MELNEQVEPTIGKCGGGVDVYLNRVRKKTATSPRIGRGDEPVSLKVISPVVIQPRMRWFYASRSDGGVLDV